MSDKPKPNPKTKLGTESELRSLVGSGGPVVKRPKPDTKHTSTD